MDEQNLDATRLKGRLGAVRKIARRNLLRLASLKNEVGEVTALLEQQQEQYLVAKARAERAERQVELADKRIGLVQNASRLLLKHVKQVLVSEDLRDAVALRDALRSLRESVSFLAAMDFDGEIYGTSPGTEGLPDCGDQAPPGAK